MKLDTPAAFNAAYRRRIRTLREDLGWTTEEMAKALGIPAENYRKYEGRSNMPIYLIERFALIVRRDPIYVLTGKKPTRRSPGPANPPDSNAPPSRTGTGG